MKKFSYVSKKLLKDMGAGGGGDPTLPERVTVIEDEISATRYKVNAHSINADGVKTLNELFIELYNYLITNNVLIGTDIKFSIDNIQVSGKLQRSAYSHFYELNGFSVATDGFTLMHILFNQSGIQRGSLDGIGQFNNGTYTKITIDRDRIISSGIIFNINEEEF